jgi:SAM-dependent methyltransferase
MARRQLVRRRLANVAVMDADPEALPFPDGQFDVVTSAAAVHHLASPGGALEEMARVCAPGGRVAIEDIVAPEQCVRARYLNRIERLRDRTHERVLSLSELIGALGEAGLRVRKVTVREWWREFNEWVGVTRPPARRAERIRRLLQGSVEQDLSGLRVQAEDDTFVFVQEVAWVLAVRPG